LTTTPAEFETPPERGLRYFARRQTPWSWVTLGVGILSMVVLFAGTIAILSNHGWTQQCPGAFAEGVLDSVGLGPTILAAQEAAGITPMRAVACTPTTPLTEGLLSPELGILALVAIGIGAVAAALAVLRFRRVPNKQAREAAIAGAVIGIQGALLAAGLLWFRSSNVELFSRNFLNVRLLGDFFPRFVNGAKNTLILSVLGGALGMLGGLLLALFSMSKRAVIRAPARIYINFFRGTPLIWQLSFTGLGVVTALKLGFFQGINGPYRVAILVLGLNLAAYSAEVYRAGIQSLERGQIEAARTLGLSYLQAMRYVIVPQAVRRVIPPLTNEFVILIKDTSLVVVLGLAFSQKELLGTGREIYSSTFNATAWLGSAAGYLIITLPMIRLVTYLERRLRSGLTSVVG
jgi:polar amino acid transport system permease protein